MTPPFARDQRVTIRNRLYLVADCYASVPGVWTLTVRDEGGALQHFDIEAGKLFDGEWVTCDTLDAVAEPQEPIVESDQGELF